MKPCFSPLSIVPEFSQFSRALMAFGYAIWIQVQTMSKSGWGHREIQRLSFHVQDEREPLILAIATNQG